MATVGWFDRILASFAAIVRRRGLGAGAQSGLEEESSTADRLETLIQLVRANFQERAGFLPDVSPLEAFTLKDGSFYALTELVALIGMRGFAYDPEKLADWHRLSIPPATLYGVLELTKPKTDKDLDTLFEVLQPNAAKIQVEALRPVATAYQVLNRPLAVDNLVLAIDALGVSAGMSSNGFLPTVEAYEAVGPADPRLDRLLLQRVRDEEALAASAALLDAIASRVGQVASYDDISSLMEQVTDRITVRRLTKVLSLFDEFGVKSGELDTFHLSFANSQSDLEWLERAIKGLSELGRPIDRVALMQLREWAPEIGALGRYLTAVRSFNGIGLKVEEIDKLVLKRVESEEQSQVLGQLGELWFRIGFGELTLERAERMADILTDRGKLKRFETAVNLLKELKMSMADIQILAEQFYDQADDIYWLEAVVASAGESEERMGRLQILHLRERYPEPPILYRYFRLKRAFEWFQGEAQALEALLLDVAPVTDQASNLLALAEVLQSDPGKLTIAEIKELEETYDTSDLIEAFATCVRTFNGDWRRFNQFFKQVRESGDLDACLALVNRMFGDTRLSGNQFERALEYLLMHMQAPPMVPYPPGH